MQTSATAPVAISTIRCRIAACASLRADADTIRQWRRQPIAHGDVKMSPSFLKHSDEQTVVVLTAVLSAIEQAGWQKRSFADWGVLAAPNLLGRVSIAETIQRFLAEGAWGVSPQLIPHQSLHAVSGTISQALSIHGPNFGIGGGPDAGPDAFLLAAAMLRDVPGLWLVLSGYESEWIPNVDTMPPAPMCLGVALALTMVNDEPVERGLSICTGSAEPMLMPVFTLASFIDELPRRTASWRLCESQWLELDGEAHA